MVNHSSFFATIAETLGLSANVAKPYGLDRMATGNAIGRKKVAKAAEHPAEVLRALTEEA